VAVEVHVDFSADDEAFLQIAGCLICLKILKTEESFC
jgi:hypothetical protein